MPGSDCFYAIFTLEWLYRLEQNPKLNVQIFLCFFFFLYFPVIHIEWPFIRKPHFVQQDLAPLGLPWAEQWGPTHAGLCYWIWLQDLELTNYRPARSVEQGVSQPTSCTVSDEEQWWAHGFTAHLILHKISFLMNNIVSETDHSIK